MDRYYSTQTLLIISVGVKSFSLPIDFDFRALLENNFEREMTNEIFKWIVISVLFGEILVNKDKPQGGKFQVRAFKNGKKFIF